MNTGNVLLQSKQARAKKVIIGRHTTFQGTRWIDILHVKSKIRFAKSPVKVFVQMSLGHDSVGKNGEANRALVSYAGTVR